MQVYRGFDIGTDKPPLEARENIPHHLLDIADPSQQFTAADFVREALRVIWEINHRHRLPLVVGGTGLYIKALIDGLFPGPGRDDQIRQALEREAREKGLESLRRKLEEVDPVYAQKIGKNDRIRIIRALEVYHLTQKPISEHFLETRSYLEGFHVLKIGLKLYRDLLYQKIEQRVDRMFKKGIVEEVWSLLARGVKETSPPFRALGYRQVLRHLRREISLEEAVAETKKETRHYAKRQMTWFRKMRDIVWFDADDISSIARFVQKNLNS